MPYPERKPIYETYIGIIDKIIAEKKYKSFAKAEIEDLNSSIIAAFKEISLVRLEGKEWPQEDI